MEGVAAGVAARGVALPVSSSAQLTNKDRQFCRNSRNEANNARDQADNNYFSATKDDNVDNSSLRQKLHDVVKQREELQQIEIELRAQYLVRSEIVDMQTSFDAQMKEHASTKAKLQEQLREREQTIRELEKRIEEKEMEMHVLQLDSKAAWAKEDLLREQSLELQSYRRERENSEAQRAQHIKQIDDLQELMQEKERQFLELQEQNRIAQETILFKDEHLREAQSWITRVQEMDVLQSSTHHTLQAELQERTELCNQLWIGCRQQYMELERLHLYIQQLQLELTEAREKNGIIPDSSHGGQTNSKELTQHEQKSGGQLDSSENRMAGGNQNVLVNDNAENSNHSNAVLMAPSSLLGFPSYPSTGQMAALHPFFLHEHVPSNIPQTHVNHLHPIPVLQEWPNQQTASESPVPNNDQKDPGLLRSESNYGYGTSVNGNVFPPDYLDTNHNQNMESNNIIPSLSETREGFESIDESYSVSAQYQQNIQQISSQFHEALRVDLHDHNGENKEKNLNHLVDQGVEPKDLVDEEPGSDPKLSLSETSAHPVNFSNLTMNNVFSSTGERSNHVVEKLAEIPLLDEKPLLACIVRTIPPGSGGKIRISSTLPNRLGKMLAPLHWHDYKKKYGKLEEFVSRHPELFVIEGDYIQLKEGAQEIIAATAAFAKVAAATAATISHSQHLPSIAVTPMAQSHRSKFLSTVKVLSKPKDHLEPNGSESNPIYSVGLNGTNGTNTGRKGLGTSPSNVIGRHKKR